MQKTTQKSNVKYTIMHPMRLELHCCFATYKYSDPTLDAHTEIYIN